MREERGERTERLVREEGWFRVPGKRWKPRWDTKVSVLAGEDLLREIVKTTFFFTVFPDDHNAKDMYAIFSDFGHVDEVIIPPKKDFRGKIYGFARFFNVGDIDLMATKLDNIFIGSRKLHVNLPKFTRK